MNHPKQDKHQITVSKAELYSGPVPPPEALAKYELIQPGFADRLLKMAEKEQNERINTNNKFIDTDKEISLAELGNQKRGQIFALLSVLLVVILCVYSFYLGHSKEARDIAVAVIIGLAGVFITGRIILLKKNEKINKD